MTDSYAYDDDLIQKIQGVDFTLWGNDEVLRSSALGKDSIGIDIADLYENTEPKKGGLIDTRMGAIKSDCSTCALNSSECPGHFGHITLSEPVFHMGLIHTVKKILMCICLKCSKLLIFKNEEELLDMVKNKSGRTRLSDIRNMVKNVTYCQKAKYGCGAPVTKIKLDVNKKTCAINIVSEITQNSVPGEDDKDGKKKKKSLLTPNLCYHILSHISDVDCKIMGIDPAKSRPEDMIYKIFPVPPVQVRPSAKADFGSSSTMEDDLTHKLADIIRANQRLRRYKESLNDNAGKYERDHTHLLQYHTAAYYDNDSCSLPKSEQKGKSTKSLTSRLKSKEGRIRGNLMGKRVNFSARTVITADPTIDINQVGVPIKIAMNITFPEIVTPQNIDKLSQLVRNGRDIYPGANFVFRGHYGDNKHQRSLPIDLRYRREKIDLKYGDIVERHIVDDDYVLLNRQPTLHKLSMMGHRIKVIHDENLQTFRLNVAVTLPYNADFDGDEMNIFIPQSNQTMIELKEIADVKRQIITPGTSAPIIGIKQDGLIGAHNLTHPKMMIDWHDAMNIVSYTAIDDFDDFKKKDLTGSELFSLIVPSKINTEAKGIKIENGKLTKGVLTGGNLKGANSLIHLVWDEYGMEKTQSFIDDIQRLINNFNMYHGATCGVGDIEVSEDTKKKINALYETENLEVKFMLTEMENNPNLQDKELFEVSIYQKLDTIRDKVSKLIMDNLSENNNMRIIITCGAVGTASNMGQMGGFLGQQAVAGKRIQKKVNGRALPYFHQDDDSAVARGFADQALVNGIKLPGFIFHNMGAREGIIDTAIKTAESGYVQRKLIKALEDSSIKYDGTVRSANNGVIQFIYGDNGINTIKQSKHTFAMIEMDNKDLRQKFCFTDEELKKVDINKEQNEKYYEMLIDFRTKLRDIQFKENYSYAAINKDFMLPFNMHRIIANNVAKKTKTDTPLKATYVLDKLVEILEYTQTQLTALTEKQQKDKNGIKYQDEMIAKTMSRFALHEYLSPKRCIFEYKANKEQFDEMFNQIVNSFNGAVIQPGEMVGIIAAQSCGEPVTQMTLNTFHHSGIASMGTSNLGVDRIKELLSLTKNPKEPIVMVYLNPDIRENLAMVNKIAYHIKYTTIGDLAKKLEIFYDPDPFKKDGFMDKDGATNIFYGHNVSKNSCQTDIATLPWLMRITLDREKMMNKEVTMLDIKSKFCSQWERRYNDLKGVRKEERQLLEKITQCAVVSNHDNSKHPVIHVRLDLNDFNLSTLINFQEVIINKFRLKGIWEIENVKVNIDERVLVFDPKTGGVEKKTQHVIYTSGINMVDIRYVNGIDLSRTICNDVVQVYQHFGIEAARTVLMKEIRMVYQNAGKDVNYQHLSILIDTMTNNGNLTSVNRHGLNRLDTDPFARASFEKTIEQLLTAAIFGERDHMRSVSSRIMAGMVIKGGTGLCDLMLDTEMLENSEYIENLDQKYHKTFNEIGGDAVMDDMMKKTTGSGFIPM